MVLMFAGAIIALVGIGTVSEHGYGAVVVGVILFLVGAGMSFWHTENTRASANRTRYWSRGTRPDTDSRQDESDDKIRAKQKDDLQSALALVVFAAIVYVIYRVIAK